MGNSDDNKLDVAQFSGTAAVDRVVGDLRRGVPVVVADGGFSAIVIAAELVEEAALEALADSPVRPILAVTPARAEALKVPSKGREVVCLELAEGQSMSRAAADISALADPTQDLGHPLSGPHVARDDLSAQDSAIALAALVLCRRAGLLPAACLWRIDVGVMGDLEAWAEKRGFLYARADQVMTGLGTIDVGLRQVAAAKLPISVAENTRIVAFRPVNGGTEHFALILGSPNTHDPVLVRVHSACFTGDLLGSLKCDCGTQLQSALKVIAEAGSGVLLYMDQEGRGIGLLAKLKAYALQDQGFDTVDANLRLGFEVDERSFAPAAAMLKTLGFRTIRLLTNNPDKVAGLEAEGITVIERVAHSFPANVHNEAYLATKKSRSGHIL